MSYTDHVLGLRFLERGHTPTTRGDWERAQRALASLYSDMVGAGGNTWQDASDRYTRARNRFAAFPRPCDATLGNVTEPCPKLASKNSKVCERCHANIIDIAAQTGMMIEA